MLALLKTDHFVEQEEGVLNSIISWVPHLPIKLVYVCAGKRRVDGVQQPIRNTGNNFSYSGWGTSRGKREVKGATASVACSIPATLLTSPS